MQMIFIANRRSGAQRSEALSWDHGVFARVRARTGCADLSPALDTALPALAPARPAHG